MQKPGTNMRREWQLERASGDCAVSGRKLAEGEEFYTVLFDEGESFRRAEYAVEHWAGVPEGAFCHFKSRVPVKQARKQKLLVDDDALVTFFNRLADEQALTRVQFRFVLALILMRKRVLRYIDTKIVDGAETWTMTLVKDKSTHKVVNPHLSDEEIGGVSQELTSILQEGVAQTVQEHDALDQADTSVDEPAGDCADDAS